MTRRANHEGSEPKLRADGRWASSLRLPDGRRHSVYGKTVTDCRNNVRKYLADMEHGVTRVTGTTTVTQWLDQWLATYGTDLRPTTFSSYKLQIDRYITPQIGAVRLARLTPDHMQALKNYLATTALSGTSQRYVLNVLSSALNRAVKSRKLHDNPLRLIDLPPKSTTPLSVWDIKQTQTFLASIEGDRLEPLYVLAALCGLRQGELLGLRWSDTTLAKGIIAVTQQYTRAGTTAPLKTVQSRRVVVLPTRAAELLRARQTAQKTELLAAGRPRGNKLDLIFTETNGRPLTHTNVTRTFYKRVIKAGLPHIPFHGLRHVAATLQLASGATMPEIAGLLGHSDESDMTRRYAHLLPASRQATADRTNQLFPAKRKAL